ncbi:MAG TPA: glycerol-3-phosphate dehydrogenase, partial [Verrucomicrobia bacterium]|nr:glycerol-3-phosphate dehydrogenase [Verrucomicrobiota bacterium]
MKIAIIGDGGWGTANALLLAGYGHTVTLWGAFPEYIEEMRRTRRNDKFLKGVALPESLLLTSDRAAAVSGADVVVLAPPSKYFAPVMEGFKGLVTNGQLVVSLTKGLCEKTNK